MKILNAKQYLEKKGIKNKRIDIIGKEGEIIGNLYLIDVLNAYYQWQIEQDQNIKINGKRTNS